GLAGVTSGQEGAVGLWRTAPCQRPGEVLRPHDRVRGVAFLPDGGSLVLAGGDGTAQVWGLPAPRTVGPPLVPLPNRPQPITQVAYSPSGGHPVTPAPPRGLRWGAENPPPAGGAGARGGAGGSCG